MLRSLSLISVTGFWLTMMGLLISREFFQFTPVEAPYEVLTLEDTRIREEYQAHYLGKKRIGFGFMVLEKKENSPSGEFELRHSNYLSFLLLGRENEMLLKGTAVMDSQLHLRDFTVRISGKDYWNELKGQIAKNAINVVVEGKDSEPVRKIIPIQGPLFYSESLDFIWTPENLKVGKRGRIQVWNPVLMNIEDVDFRVERKETITYEDKPAEVYVVYLGKEGLETRYWISPEGITLRKENPTGLMSQKEVSWKIFDAMRLDRSSPPDLPNLFSIPSNQTLKNPEQLKRLKIKITSPGTEKILTLERQDISSLSGISLPVTSDTENLAPFLESNELIQADDPEIQAKAREIIAGETSALRAALKLMLWVHDYVSPMPTASLPSAKQVLSTKHGDCNEYTALFTALARSLGIPTKMIAGLVYRNERFFYHAWAKIYLGQWIGIDPTFAQAPADVTHIPLVEGNVQEQAMLANQLGKIKAFILEAES